MRYPIQHILELGNSADMRVLIFINNTYEKYQLIQRTLCYDWIFLFPLEILYDEF